MRIECWIQKFTNILELPVARQNFGISHDRRCTRAEKLQCVLSIEFSGPEKKRCISKFFNLFCDFPSFFFNTRLWICSSYQINIIKGLRQPFLQTVTKLALNGVIKVLGLIPLHIGLPRLCKSQLLWRKQMHFKTFQSYVLIRRFANMPKFEC